MTFSVSSQKGSRSYQEDRYAFLDTGRGMLLAVMDGHGGAQTAQHAHDVLPSLWQVWEHLSDYTEILQHIVKDLAHQTSLYVSGSTLSMVFIPYDNSVAYVAVMGDSPVAIWRDDGTLWIAPEHNVRTNAAERQAAEARGGFYDDGGYICKTTYGVGLQMARALGDAELGEVIQREAEYFTVPLSPDAFVLLATDGVVDPGHVDPSAALTSVLDLIHRGLDAGALVDAAINAPTEDNATAILYRV